MWLFSAVLLFVDFMMVDAMGLSEPIFAKTSHSYLETLTGQAQTETTPDPNFIEGDWLTGATALGGIFGDMASGGVLADGLLDSPIPLREPVAMLIRFLFVFSQAMLIINIMTGRSL